MKALAIISGDWHIHTWKSFNENGRRLNAHIRAVLDLGIKAIELGCPILFTGDLGHNFGKITLELIDNLLLLRGMPRIIGISGNHDQERANYSKDRACRSLWHTFCSYNERAINIDWKYYETAQLRIFGIPYLTYNKTFIEVLNDHREELNLQKYNILMIHTDLHGAMDGGREVGSVEGIPKDMEELFKDFNLVVSGHIHQHQKLGKNIYMIGALQQQRRSDMGNAFGYYILYEDNDRLKMQFQKTEYPEFRLLSPGQTPPDDIHYYTTEEVSKEEIIDDLGFSTTTTKAKLVKNYMKAIGDKSISKRLALTRILNRVSDDNI